MAAYLVPIYTTISGEQSTTGAYVEADSPEAAVQAFDDVPGSDWIRITPAVTPPRSETDPPWRSYGPLEWVRETARLERLPNQRAIW